jgi:beta-lactam-binding protein with PASTA domain
MKWIKWIKKIINRQALLGYLIASGVLLILAMTFDKIVLPIYTQQYNEVEMPDIVEKSADEADSILNAHGFRMIIDKSEYHPVLPESTIVFQKPSPYTKVKRGRRIYVHISLGEKQAVVPRVIGISERDAQFRIVKAGLEAGNINYQVSSYPKDVVCDQTQLYNTQVPIGTKIDFTVSLGRSKTDYVVPNVQGRNLNEAILVIKREGLTMGKIMYKTQVDIIPQTVISQNPSPGQSVSPHSAVNLVISQLPMVAEEGDSSAID